MQVHTAHIHANRPTAAELALGRSLQCRVCRWSRFKALQEEQPQSAGQSAFSTGRASNAFGNYRSVGGAAPLALGTTMVRKSGFDIYGCPHPLHAVVAYPGSVGHIPGERRMAVSTRSCCGAMCGVHFGHTSVLTRDDIQLGFLLVSAYNAYRHRGRRGCVRKALLKSASKTLVQLHIIALDLRRSYAIARQS